MVSHIFIHNVSLYRYHLLLNLLSILYNGLSHRILMGLFWVLLKMAIFCLIYILIIIFLWLYYLIFLIYTPHMLLLCLYSTMLSGFFVNSHSMTNQIIMVLLILFMHWNQDHTKQAYRFYLWPTTTVIFISMTNALLLWDWAEMVLRVLFQILLYYYVIIYKLYFSYNIWME